MVAESHCWNSVFELICKIGKATAPTLDRHQHWTLDTVVMASSMLLILACSAYLFSCTSGHGMLVNPRPRNSIDHLVDVNDPSNKCR